MKILDDLGMNPANLGYTYWEEAIKLRKGNYFDIKMCNIYDKIAQKFGKTQKQIERSMRHSRMLTKDINKKFKVDCKIDNRTFLALLIKNSNKGDTIIRWI